MSVVRVENLVKDVRPGFGLRVKRLLHGITFNVERGESFGFVGPNGAGKTTTLKLLMGLIRPTSGTAEILGHPVGGKASRQAVGFLPENPYFYRLSLTGREILELLREALRSVPACGAAMRGSRCCSTGSGSRHAADARLRTYSKGMQQRVGIAQALVHDPGRGLPRRAHERPRPDRRGSRSAT